MKRHWIHSEDPQAKTDCGLEIPEVTFPVRSGIQNCPECVDAVVEAAEHGALYCGVAKAVVF